MTTVSMSYLVSSPLPLLSLTEKKGSRLLCQILHLGQRHHLHKQRLLLNAQCRRCLLIQHRVLALESCPRHVLLDKEKHVEASRTRQRLFERRIRIDGTNEAASSSSISDSSDVSETSSPCSACFRSALSNGHSGRRETKMLALTAQRFWALTSLASISR